MPVTDDRSRMLPMSSTPKHPGLGDVLVTGGCGFLGSNVVKALLAESSCKSITVISRSPNENIYPGVIYRAVDISDHAKVSSLLIEIQPRVIIHTTAPRFNSPYKTQHKTTVIGTQNLLDSADACPSVQAFVYTSSDSAFHPQPGLLTESDCELYTLNSHATAYQRTKGHADHAVLSANSENLKTACLRMSTIYGPRDPYFVPGTLDQLAKGQHKIQFGKNVVLRDAVYVDSAASAHVLAAKALLARKSNVEGQAFFVSDDEPMPFYDLSRKIFYAAGDRTDWKKEVQIIPFWLVLAIASVWEWVFWVAVLGRREPEIKREVLAYVERPCWFSIEKARVRLGYKPLVGTDEGVRRSVEWALESRKNK